MAKGDNTASKPQFGGNVYGGFFKPQMGQGNSVWNSTMSPKNPMGSPYGVGPSPGNTPPPALWNPTGPRMGYGNPTAPIGLVGSMGANMGINNPAPPQTYNGEPSLMSSSQTTPLNQNLGNLAGANDNSLAGVGPSNSMTLQDMLAKLFGSNRQYQL